MDTPNWKELMLLVNVAVNADKPVVFPSSLVGAPVPDSSLNGSAAAYTKFAQLVAYKLDQASLRIAEVASLSGTKHTVLLVYGNHETWVLDDRINLPMHIHVAVSLGYQFQRIQIPSTDQWDT